jgi:hypothetical protein
MIDATQAAHGTPMQTLIRAAVVITVAGTLFACKPKADPTPVADVAPAEEIGTELDENMLEACLITITEPESIRWTTYWDAAAVMNNSESPSNARSIYWANEEERKSLGRSSSAAPLTIRCSSNDSPSISLSFSSYSSTEQQVPLDSGEYEIVPSSAGDPQPGQFVAGSVLFDQRTIEPISGTLTIDRFDLDGVRGSFRMDGRERGEDGEEFRLEGTFDLPCGGGAMESACESTRSVSR